jgi:hypothetical protein
VLPSEQKFSMGKLTLFKWITLTVFIQASVPAFSQPSYFAKEFGDSSLSNHANSVLQLNSGSIFIAGYASTGSGSLNRDFTLTKLDAAGNIIWTNYYGSQDDETSARMIFNGSKSLIICGQLYDTSQFTTSAVLMSVDTLGHLEWFQNYINMNASQSFSGLCLSNDGGLLASGFQGDTAGAGNNFLLMKTNAQGSMEWMKTYGDPDNNEISDAVYQLPDGNILLSGDRQVDASTYNAWLIKADSAGSQIWDLISANRNNGGCKNILVDNDNNILVIGESATDSSADFDIQLTKCDQSGNLIWMKYVPATNESDAGFAIQQDAPGYYMITGYYYDTLSASKKMMMMLLDTAGIEINRKLFGNGLQNIGYDLQPSVYGGYLIAGTDFSNSKYVLVYDYVPPPTGIQQFAPASAFINAWPNPFADAITVNGTAETGTLQLFDISGKEVLHKKTDLFQTPINVEFLTAGFYLLRYTDRLQTGTIRLLKF